MFTTCEKLIHQQCFWYIVSFTLHSLPKLLSSVLLLPTNSLPPTPSVFMGILSACISVCHMHAVCTPKEVRRERFIAPETKVTVMSCYVCWELNQGSLEEQANALNC